jgi:AAA domain
MVEISSFTLMLVVCLGICMYLIFNQKKALVPEIVAIKQKRFTKNSSENSILTLHKVQSLTSRPKKVLRICITGGPSGGKKSSQARLAFRLPEMGYKVISVPDAAALLKQGGANINISKLDKTQQILIQLRIIKLSLALEDIYTEIAERAGENVIVICNTGVMDGAAYVSEEVWQAILDELGVTAIHLRDFRYDAVIHLVSTANGAERHYSSSQYGNIEQARTIDRKLQEVYTGHPDFSIISNESVKNFEEKLQKVTEIVFSKLNINTPSQYSFKLLVKVNTDQNSIPIIPDYIKYQKIYVEEIFLESGPDEIIRVQKRGNSDSYNYKYTVEKIREDKTLESASQIISPRDYMNHLKKRDKTRSTVKRILQCFIIDDDYMILDTFQNIKFKGSLLRVETKKMLEDITFPEFIEVERDVKDDPGYSTHKLAKTNWYNS